MKRKETILIKTNKPGLCTYAQTDNTYINKFKLLKENGGRNYES
jgi:hypothetical protein